MWAHFVNNNAFLLLNKNYESYKNQTLGNECGISCCIIITQFHNLTTISIEEWSPTKSMTSPPISRHYCHMPIMAVRVSLLAKFFLLYMVSIEILTVLVRL